MMEFRSEHCGNEIWYPSKAKTPAGLKVGYRVVLTSEGLRYMVKWSDGTERIYRWVDMDPLVESVTAARMKEGA